MMTAKTDVHVVIKQFLAYVQTQFNKRVKIFRSDNGKEFTSTLMTTLLKDLGILPQTTCSYTPQQNGIAERKHRHLLEVARALRLQVSLPKQFWSDCILTATHIINRLPSSVLNQKIPLEILLQHPVTYCHLRVFGCQAFATITTPHKDKLDARAIKAIFLGYPIGKKAYKLLNLSNMEIFFSRDVVFSENIFPGETTSLFFDHQPTHTTDPSYIPSSPISPSNSHQPIRPKRTHKPPAYLKMYETVIPGDHSSKSASIRYPIAHYISSSALSPTYASYVANITKLADPTCYTQAAKDPKWVESMQSELNALELNKTWEVVNAPSDRLIIGCKWLFRIKYNADDSIHKYKSRLVAKGYTQNEGIHYFQTFAPVAKMTSVRTLLAVAALKGWSISQLDVTNAFLHGDLSEEIFMKLPPGYTHPDKAKFSNPVCRLLKSLYGLKQAPRQWFQKFSTALLQFGPTESKADSSLFTIQQNGQFAALLVYVDDILITWTCNVLIQQLKDYLLTQFVTKDLGPLKYFLGIEIAHSSQGIYINQRKYTLDILTETGLLGCKPSNTPMDSSTKLLPNTGTSLTDPDSYRRLVGKLVYLTITRPDICFAVHTLCQFLAAPTELNLQAALRVVRYLKSAPAQGILYSSSGYPRLTAYCDSDWASCPITRRSVSGYLIFFGSSLISWKSKKQHTVARSSAEAEYRSLANTACEITWISALLKDLGVSVPLPVALGCDNRSAIAIANNPVFHERTKHIEIDCHLVRDKITADQLRPFHVPSLHQPADLMTKAVTPALFLSLLSKLQLVNIFAPAA